MSNNDRLSEFAHPGWARTTLLFSKLDDSKTIVEFGENERANDTMPGSCFAETEYFITSVRPIGR